MLVFHRLSYQPVAEHGASLEVIIMQIVNILVIVKNMLVWCNVEEKEDYDDARTVLSVPHNFIGDSSEFLRFRHSCNNPFVIY